MLNAKVADEAFPIVLYNPGAGNPHFGGTYQSEVLASHGYIVVAIGHTGLTGIVRFPDGTEYTPRPDAPGFSLPREQMVGLNEVEQFEARKRNAQTHIMPLHVADVSFVLDQLTALNDDQDSPLYHHLDLQKIGALGFSLGGALSLQVARDDPRVKAAVNLDGWLYTDVTETGLSKPVLMIHNSAPNDLEPPDRRELRLFAESQDWKLLRQVQADWYDVTITGTVHRYFSDRMRFDRQESGYLPVRYVHHITNGYVREFFDKYLKGAEDGPLLSGMTTFPEVKMISSSSFDKPKDRFHKRDGTGF